MILWLCLLPALISGTDKSWSAQMEAALESRVGRETEWDERHLAGIRRGSMTETQDGQEPYPALTQSMHRCAMATEPHGPARACPARGTGVCHTLPPHSSSWHGHTEPGHHDVAGNHLGHGHSPCPSAGREQRGISLLKSWSRSPSASHHLCTPCHHSTPLHRPYLCPSVRALSALGAGTAPMLLPWLDPWCLPAHDQGSPRGGIK